MYAAMIKQALMGMGVKDEATVAMVDRIAAIGFENFAAVKPQPGEKIDVPEGSQALLLGGRNQKEGYRLLLICEKFS